MAVFRLPRTANFTVMSNHHFYNRHLSLKAMGLLSLMLSLPPDWDFTMKGLATICGDGISSVRSGIKELEEHGYLIRRRIREANGRLGDVEYTILENPQIEVEVCASAEPPINSSASTPCRPSTPYSPKSHQSISDKPTSIKPICENPTQDNPTHENRTQLNTNRQNKQGLNTQGLSIHQSIPQSQTITSCLYRPCVVSQAQVHALQTL